MSFDSLAAYEVIRTNHMEKQVSIIIPVYNADKYLGKCMDSLLRQSYRNLEIIIINDGSLDESESVILKRKSYDSRIIYVKQENRGVSIARNHGLEVAQGEYIIFVDADDYVHEDYVKELVGLMKDHELGACGYIRVNNSDEAEFAGYDSNQELVRMSSEDFTVQLFGNRIYQGYLWNKIFIRRIIHDNNIMFDKEIFYNEDRLFVLMYLMKCTSVGVVNKPLYYYLNNEFGAMGQAKQSIDRKAFSEFDAYKKMLEILKSRGMEEAYSKAAIDQFISAKRLLQISDRDNRGAIKKLLNNSTKTVWKSNADKKDKIKILIKRFYNR